MLAEVIKMRSELNPNAGQFDLEQLDEQKNNAKILAELGHGLGNLALCRQRICTGTLLHDSHLPLWKWLVAVSLFAEADKIRNDLAAKGIQLKDGKDAATGRYLPGSVIASGSNREIVALWAELLGRTDVDALFDSVAAHFLKRQTEVMHPVVDFNGFFARLRFQYHIWRFQLHAICAAWCGSMTWPRLFLATPRAARRTPSSELAFR